MEKINLPDVTAVAVDCTDRIRDTLSALKKSAEHINFGEIVLLSNRKPYLTKELPDFYTYKHIKKIENINQYSEFMFKELYKYIDTDFALTIQDHAYVLHPDVWDNEWLTYDYLGGLWLYKKDAYIANTGEHVRNGNGGFSLRSKKLMELPSVMGWGMREEQGFKNEDGQINCYWRKEMLGQGIRYAPTEASARFSYENLMSENYGIKPFGFHRNFPIKTWGD